METSTEAKLSASELGLRLGYFTGTEHYYKHWLPGLVFTDGVKYLADKAGAYWLIDIVASYQPKLRKMSSGLREFQLWTLKVNEETREAVVTCQADLNTPNVVRQLIPYTDFPLAEIKLYVEGNVLLLPSEH